MRVNVRVCKSAGQKTHDSTLSNCWQSRGNPNKVRCVDNTRHKVDNESYLLRGRYVPTCKKKKATEKLGGENVYYSPVQCWKGEVVLSYLTSLLLPEDGRLRVSLGLTREGGGATLSHYLVSWTDDKLGCSWCRRVKTQVLVEWRGQTLGLEIIGARGYQAKTSTVPHGQIKMGKLYRASMQHFPSFAL